MSTASAREVARLLIDIGVLLLKSGAHTERTIRNLKRVAAAFGYEPDIFVAFSGLTLTIHGDKQSTTLFGRVSAHGVHLSTLAAISRLTWRVESERLSIAEIYQELEVIKALPHYPRWIILLMIGLGCGALARIAGAEWLVVIATVVASSVALSVRMQLTKWNVNFFLVVMASAMTATVLGGMATSLHLGRSSDLAVASSVLFLIPGVPLINGIMDLINGYMTIGLARLVMGSAISFSLSCGMLLGMQIVGVSI
ncbi:threonine/serine exporter family protein [Sansalvadorimonas verongulae]|uniref:threonine/serine ThrE exporter family protein n=1 Tax=Sansalvadorimonas verongulae TaxID=2172824 RepID=UPI0012BC5941|nr:threonine/serine exporter family protein [Sansalvadorimonas verongulae]MTI14621.1 threonine/serine exporter [Sansalvadorimonas verongulae]